MKKKKDKKVQNFIKYVAEGMDAYPAAIKAGYSKNYANCASHKLLGKYKEEIEAFKPIAQKAIEEEFKYSVKDSFKKLCEIQELALLPDEEGNYRNLTAATKAEELKGKMYGVYEADNAQHGVTINYSRNYE